jgi:hypothetical protein
MSKERRAFRRPQPTRSYRKIFLIAVEGAKTEPAYFRLLNESNSVIDIRCVRGAHESSPPQVLDHLTREINRTTLKKTDEAWLVVDKDSWTDDQLRPLYAWSQETDNHRFKRGFALSNPNFEYWLLLHFENGTRVSSPRKCSERLRYHIPDYNKDIDRTKYTPERVRIAIQRAKQRYNGEDSNWTKAVGSTTVYKLVEKILDA